MKNLLVTGGMGFIGSAFIRHVLTETGFEGRVVNFDKLTYAADPRNLEDVARRFEDRYAFVKADIADMDAVAGALSRFQVDTVLHLAAETHVDRSIADSREFVTTNVSGTWTLLEASRHLGVARFHQVSTDEVFGDMAPDRASSEESPYAPTSPYAATKAGADHLAHAFFHTFGLPVSISYSSNNYGPRQHPEKLIPKAVLKAARGEDIPVYGDGMNVRDWLYVEDHCKALWRILTIGKPGRRYAVGGNSPVTNRHVVERISALVDQVMGIEPQGPRKRLIRLVDDRPGHDRRYHTDASRMAEVLGWAPETPLEQGLEKTVRWYLEHLDRADGKI